MPRGACGFESRIVCLGFSLWPRLVTTEKCCGGKPWQPRLMHRVDETGSYALEEVLRFSLTPPSPSHSRRLVKRGIADACCRFGILPLARTACVDRTPWRPGWTAARGRESRGELVGAGRADRFATTFEQESGVESCLRRPRLCTGQGQVAAICARPQWTMSPMGVDRMARPRRAAGTAKRGGQWKRSAGHRRPASPNRRRNRRRESPRWGKGACAVRQKPPNSLATS